MPLPQGYIIGHEPMGIVEEVGPDVTKVKKGDRVVIPFNVACGHCFYCQHEMESQCDNSILIMILVDTLVIQRNLVTIQVDKQNI